LILLPFLVFAAVLVAALFIPAGRLDLPYFWAYVGVLMAYALGVGRFVMDPELRRERLRPRGGRDRWLRPLSLPFVLAHLVIAGLDAGHLHLPGAMPAWIRLIGLASMAAALSLVGWAIRVNRFFSPVVRIQEERGHHLVTGGPYRFLRHPGYLGSLVLILGSALALGSWWAGLPLLVPVALLLRRAALEDRFLKEHLEGYRQYAGRVRFRLVPGVW
jgi:protein-S-isoprenylcysteine O-methyltransferase Ste14